MPESIAPDEAVELYLQDRKPEGTKPTDRNHTYLNRFLEWSVLIAHSHIDRP